MLIAAAAVLVASQAGWLFWGQVLNFKIDFYLYFVVVVVVVSLIFFFYFISIFFFPVCELVLLYAIITKWHARTSFFCNFFFFTYFPCGDFYLNFNFDFILKKKNNFFFIFCWNYFKGLDFFFLSFFIFHTFTQTLMFSPFFWIFLFHSFFLFLIFFSFFLSFFDLFW